MKSTYIYVGLLIALIAGLVIIRNASDGGGKVRITAYDDFGQCLTDAGAKFYGAYWCPHCGDQKNLFDKSAKIPYIECSTPDGKGQLQQCIDAEIKGYPTWRFADGTVVDRVMQIAELEEKTQCKAPQV